MNILLIEVFNRIYKAYLEGITPEIFFRQMTIELTNILDANIELFIRTNDDFILITPEINNKIYILQLPIMFNNKMNGILKIYTQEKELINTTKEFRIMLGVLINNLNIKNNVSNNNARNFIAYVSHELRNPLQVINTGTYMCKKLFDDIENEILSDTTPKSDSDSMNNSLSDLHNKNDTGMIKQILKKVNSACENMNVIIDDILDLTKIDNDELHLNLGCYELKEIIECVYEEFYIIAQKKGLEFEYFIDKSCPDYINTDNTRLYQILSNLINNSIKYSKTGKIIFNINFDKDILIFSVIDNGRGIKEDELDKLFKAFGRTSESMNDIGSTGLGLCVSNKIAELLGGKITVSSEYNKGSTFSLYHPISHSCNNTKNNMKIIYSKNKKGKILIVDDDKNITSLFKLLLNFMNYEKSYDLEVDTANTSDRTIDLTTRTTYNLIFMDIELGDCDGVFISKMIKEKHPNIIIIAITANIKVLNKEYNCFNDILIKPFNNEEINNVILKFL
jgi:signal transduction histidine kinase